MKQLFFIHLFFIVSCSTTMNDKSENNLSDSTNQHKIISKIIIYKPLQKLSILGDFDGNGKIDTLYQDNISKLTHLPIDTFPDPFNNEWDTVINFFNKQESDVILTLSKKQSDTLHLGTGLGLYCLINIGDNNNDGKDEIAFVVDVCDYSRMNTCNIYTLCKNKWTELKTFGIHEGAFDFQGETIPLFKEIEGFLEYRSNTWKFKDDDQQEYETVEEVIQGKQLKIEKCL